MRTGRREFLRVGVAGGTVGFVFGTFPETSARQGADEGVSRLSKAVIQSAGRSVANMVNKERTKSLEAQDVHRAAAIVQLMFEHFDEVGLSAFLEKEMRKQQSVSPASRFSDDQLSRLRADLESYGLSVSTDEILSLRTRFSNHRASDNSLASKTIQHSNKALIECFNEYAASLEQKQSGALPPSDRASSLRDVRVVKASARQCVFDDLIGQALAIYDFLMMHCNPLPVHIDFCRAATTYLIIAVELGLMCM